MSSRFDGNTANCGVYLCSVMPSDTFNDPQSVRLAVSAITLRRAGGDPVVVLEDAEKVRSIRVAVSPADAASIIVAIEEPEHPDVVACDVIAELFRRHEFSAECVEIRPDDVASPRYRAVLCYRNGIRRYSIELRFADAILLSVRLGAPLLARRNEALPPSHSLHPVMQPPADEDVLVFGAERRRHGPRS